VPQFSFKLTKRKQDKGGLAMITVQLGERIRELRQSTGLSQEKFALSIGMDRTYFASVELGKRNIAIINLKKIAVGLNVTLSELFENLETGGKE